MGLCRTLDFELIQYSTPSGSGCRACFASVRYSGITFADSNGSYDSKRAIEIGRLLEDYGIDPNDVSQAVMDQYRLDMRLISQKLCKTRSIE